jgi:putative membrane protein
MLRLIAVALLSTLPCAALAHSPAGSPASPAYEPWAIAALAVSALLYAIGVARLWRKAGVGRGISRAHATRFALGWITLAAALLSPIDAWGDALFSVHMVQHELLMVVAAPLLVAGKPLEAGAWALSRDAQRVLAHLIQTRALRAAWRVLTEPLGAWALHALALWTWHVPVFFQAALEHEGIHVLQHASFLASALFFWWSIVGREPRRDGSAVASLFTTMLHTGALGALLTFAPTVWYAHYAGGSREWGLSPLEDQQLGGLVMWVPAGMAYIVAALAIVAGWLSPRGSSKRNAPHDKSVISASAN